MPTSKSRRRFIGWWRPLLSSLKSKAPSTNDTVSLEEQNQSQIASVSPICQSVKGSSTSCSRGKYTTFGQMTRERLLYEMLHSTQKKESTNTPKVLIVDKLTKKIIHLSCKMKDFRELRIQLVVDLFLNRHKRTFMDAIYFIQPSEENVIRFIYDMSHRLFRKAYLFFSSPVSKDLVDRIKGLPNLGAIIVMNLEYLAIDCHGFITSNERQLEKLFSENADSSYKFNQCINTMASQISTVFVSMGEFPCIRYRAAKTSMTDSTSVALRNLIPTKLACSVWDCLCRYQQTLPDFPQEETCQLLILDRSVDYISPFIHDWTYGAMCHDLQDIEDNIYVPEFPSKIGLSTDKKKVLLNEHDPVWLEFQDVPISEVGVRLHEKMEFVLSKKKAVEYQMASDRLHDLQKLPHDMTTYQNQQAKLSPHIEIVEKIHKYVREQKLLEIGELEQDLVFGDAGIDKIICLLTRNQDITPEIIMRLLLIYMVIHPEKLKGDKGKRVMELARLSPDNLNALNNMQKLVISNLRTTVHAKTASRKEQKNEENTWVLSRFCPTLEELIYKLDKNKLPKDEYPCLKKTPVVRGTSQSDSVTRISNACARYVNTHSVKIRFPNNRNSRDYILKHSSSDLKKKGQHIFIFIVGGATRSELRVAHKLTLEMKREIILGSSSLNDPSQFISKLKLLATE